MISSERKLAISLYTLSRLELLLCGYLRKEAVTRRQNRRLFIKNHFQKNLIATFGGDRIRL